MKINCSKCHLEFSKDSIIQINEKYFCQTCKHVHLQEVKEGIEQIKSVDIKHSKLGIISLTTSILSILLWIAFFTALYNIHGRGIAELIQVLIFLIAIIVNLVSLTTGIASLFRSKVKKRLSILGVITSILAPAIIFLYIMISRNLL